MEKPTVKNLKRYIEALRCIPAPGGNGCHPALLSIANLGTLSGKDPEEIFTDIRRSIPQGTRRVTDREIQDAVQKAMSDHKGGTFTPRTRPAPIVNDGKALQRIIAQAEISTEVDLWENSPIRLLNDPKQDPALLLSTLFRPDELLFIGDRHEQGIMGRTIRTTSAWIKHFRAGGPTAQHIILNPLSGKPALTKGGDKETLRGDLCVKVFRFCLIEFDTLGREDQIRFWSAVKLPIVCLLDSGGKSIHVWLAVQKLATVETPEQWDSEIKHRLYDQILKPIGADSACSNPARLSRLPGHFRSEEKAFQKLLWLSSEGKTIC